MCVYIYSIDILDLRTGVRSDSCPTIVFVPQALTRRCVWVIDPS